ncbi:MAG: hypothetical protein GX567_13230 [Clostridia bacterium]|nr:hypothetical protein [Clostridia bacterium]
MKFQYRIIDLIVTFIGIILLTLTSYATIPLLKPDYVFYYYHISIVLVLTILYGPCVGALTGGLGYPLVQVLHGAQIDWGFGIACLIYSFSMGLLSIPFCKNEEQLKEHSSLYFIFSHILINLTVWILIAPLISILFYAKLPGDVLRISFQVFFINLIISGVISLILWQSRGFISRIGIVIHNMKKAG